MFVAPTRPRPYHATPGLEELAMRALSLVAALTLSGIGMALAQLPAPFGP